MKLGMNYGVMLLAASAGLITPQAKAQQPYKGTINLPVETYWGGTVLTPGEYTVSVEGGILGPQVLRATGSGKVAGAMIGPTESEKWNSHGRVVLVSQDGIYVLRRFDAGAIGKSFTFAPPKSVREKLGRNGPERQSIAIDVH